MSKAKKVVEEAKVIETKVKVIIALDTEATYVQEMTEKSVKNFIKEVYTYGVFINGESGGTWLPAERIRLVTWTILKEEE